MAVSVNHGVKYTPITTLVIPETSFLACRKALTSMKDVGAFITMKTRGNRTLEISVMDHFCSSAMYTPLPVCNIKGHGYVNIACEELNELINLFKTFQKSIALTITSCDNVTLSDANTKKLLYQQHYIFPHTLPREMSSQGVRAINSSNYYWVTFVSVELLSMLVNLSVGSAIMKLTFDETGLLTFANKFELGRIIIRKQLQQYMNGSQKVTLTHEHSSTTTDAAKPTPSKSPRILCKMKCVIKFIKQVVNPLVNSSKSTALLGIPKPWPNHDHPLVIQFLLDKVCAIQEQFLMMPFQTPLKHTLDESTNQCAIIHSIPQVS